MPIKVLNTNINIPVNKKMVIPKRVTKQMRMYEFQSLLGRTAVFSNRYPPTFQRCVLPPSSGRYLLKRTHYDAPPPL
jgi:hypothetical protein